MDKALEPGGQDSGSHRNNATRDAVEAGARYALDDTVSKRHMPIYIRIIRPCRVCVRARQIRSAAAIVTTPSPQSFLLSFLPSQL
jgi:hypothetical protein